METISALLAICAGNSPVPGEFPAQRPVTQSFDVFWINGRVNNREAGDVWRYGAHYNVIVMIDCCPRPPEKAMGSSNRWPDVGISDGSLMLV